MGQHAIPVSAFRFLKSLKKNNNRDWFNKHKEQYLEEIRHIELFAHAVLLELNKHDVIETPSGKKSLLRIYRDTRFSKDKTPYKNYYGAFFRRAGKIRRGNYYIHLEPGNSFIEGGFWGPNPEDLLRIRNEFAYDEKTIRKILNSKKFKEIFGVLQGEKVKTTPKGFSSDNPAIDLIRHKQFLVVRKLSDEEVLSPDFVKTTTAAFKAMRPFLDYMTEVLTTDVNGISIL